MKRRNKFNVVDIKGIIWSYVGLAFLTWWSIWSWEEYGIIGCHLIGFIVSFGGLR